VTLVTADIDKHSDVDNADACCMIFCGRFAIQHCYAPVGSVETLHWSITMQADKPANNH